MFEESLLAFDWYCMGVLSPDRSTSSRQRSTHKGLPIDEFFSGAILEELSLLFVGTLGLIWMCRWGRLLRVGDF